MEDRVTMSVRELDRLSVIREVMKKGLTQARAGEILRLSVRQVRRMAKRVKAAGSRGLVHGLRGRPSNRRIEAEVKERVLDRIREKYGDFGPSLAHEKLKEPIGRETVRKWMLEAGLHRTRRQKPRHREWRLRRAQVGELVQLDGSIHDWFEGRGARCVLVAYIDDATSRVMHAEFVPAEDTFHLFRTTRAYLQAHGRPVAFYVDRDSIYRVNRQATVDEELRDVAPLTQFERATRQLDIELIPAYSPQAKGRVERLFRTLQDRLVKELRLRKVNTLERANRFLRDVYLPEHNRRFSRPPAHPRNAHRRLYRRHALESILAFHTPRVVHNDYTVQYKRRFYQLEASQPCRVHPKATVVIEHRLDDTVHLRYGKHKLRWRPIDKRLHHAQPWHLRRIERGSKPTPGTLQYARQKAYIGPWTRS